MKFQLIQIISFVLAATIQAPAVIAQDTATQTAATNVEGGRTNDLSLANELVIAAITPLVDSDYVTAAPLLLQAKGIYEKLISEYPVEIKGEGDIAKANSIGGAAYNAFKEEDWDRSSFLYFYQAAFYPYGWQTILSNDFNSSSADRLAPLALILYKTGDKQNASMVMRAVLRSSNQDVRQAIIRKFSIEQYRLRKTGAYLEAKSITEFAIENIDQTLADSDPAALSLKHDYSAMLFNTGENEKGLRYDQIDRGPESELLIDGGQATRLITAGRLDDAVLKLEEFRRAQGDEKSESLGQDLTDALQWVPANLVDVRISGFKKAIEIFQQTPALEASASLRAIFALGAVYAFDGDYANAEQTYRNALTITERDLAADAPYNLWALANLASSLNALAKTTEARIYYQRAWDIMHDINDYTYEETSGTAGDLIKHMLRMGALEDADKLSKYVLENARETKDMEDRKLANFLSMRAATDMALNNYSAADQLFTEALALLEREPGGEYSAIQIAAYSNLAYSREAQSHYAEATSLRQKADDAALNSVLFGCCQSKVADQSRCC